ncbi:Zinc-type alcohol dehydrogenase protein [Phytophthora nicotianae]|uniref:Zinc-type alcohol dehydrogenase protein n=2 Tax=Phytophthora nicotianae TaxID=4792 RepID=A0A0W8AYI4_PHYNI|nr:Zinc-type alcohol dehydrogenase protein [Phytophthora nicotianae]
MTSSNLVFRHTDRTSHHTLRVQSERRPAVGPDEVLVQIRGVTLNYRDTIVANGTYPFPLKDDLVPCSDGAGVVVELGADVKTLLLGDRVIANFDVNNLDGLTPGMKRESLGGNVDGVLRQYIALPAQVLTKVPEESDVSFVQMASLVASGVTAWNALFGVQPLKAGQTVLFQGTGGVSIIGLQLAKAAGATTIITSSSDEKLKFVQEKFGADHVINYKTYPNWAAVANQITNGRGVDFVLENGGSGTIAQSIEAITVGGVIALIGFLSPAKQEEMPDLTVLLLGKGCIVRGISLGSQQQLRDLVQFVSHHHIQPFVQKTFGFSRNEVLEAFDYLQAGRHIGKVGIEIKHEA